MENNHKIFIAPLDWGLGHATRVVALINYYIKINWQVVLGGTGESGKWLKERYPSLTYHELPGYQITYSKKLPFVAKMLLSLPQIYKGIQAEQKEVSVLDKRYHFTHVLSDNRYGVFLKGKKNYIISHQLNIQFPFFSGSIFKLQKQLFKNFSACLVPDFSTKPNLAGKLSQLSTKQNLGVPVFYLGALSRFSQQQIPELPKKHDYLAILSGPEPLKTQLTEQLIEQFSSSKLQLGIVTYAYHAGKNLSPNIQLFLNQSEDQILNLVAQSKNLISRPGYSTLMDLVYLKKPAFFIPTPGQTEQEYLAKYCAQNHWFYYCTQKEFSLEKLKFSNNFFPFELINLEQVLTMLI